MAECKHCAEMDDTMEQLSGVIDKQTAEIEKMHQEVSNSRAAIIGLRDEIKKLRGMDRQAAGHVEGPICMRTHFTGDPPYVGWKGLGLAMVEKFDRDEAEIAKLRGAMIASRTVALLARADSHWSEAALKDVVHFTTDALNGGDDGC